MITSGSSIVGQVRNRGDMYSGVFSLCVFCFQIFNTLSVECIQFDSFPPVLAGDFGGTLLQGVQVIVDGLAFQEAANITAVHLGGVCNPVMYPGTCYGVFQVWRPSGRIYSLVHAYPLSVSVTDATYFSTSIPLAASAMSVKSGDILGFIAPRNTDVQSPAMDIATTSAADSESLGATLYTFESALPGETTYTLNKPNEVTNVLLAISPEVSCGSNYLIRPTVNDVVTTTTTMNNNNNNNNNNNPTASDSNSAGLIIGVVAAVVVVFLLIVLVVVAAVVMVLRGKRKKASHSTVAIVSNDGAAVSSLYSNPDSSHYETGPRAYGQPPGTAQNRPGDAAVYQTIGSSVESTKSGSQHYEGLGNGSGGTAQHQGAHCV